MHHLNAADAFRILTIAPCEHPSIPNNKADVEGFVLLIHSAAQRLYLLGETQALKLMEQEANGRRK